jgi:hypothetical protein
LADDEIVDVPVLDLLSNIGDLRLCDDMASLLHFKFREAQICVRGLEGRLANM